MSIKKSPVCRGAQDEKTLIPSNNIPLRSCQAEIIKIFLQRGR